MGSDFLFWQRVLRDRAYYDVYKSQPVPADSAKEDFLKGDSLLEATVSSYLKGNSVLEAKPAEYIKGDSLLTALAENYLKGDVLFLTFEEYLKGDSALLAIAERFLRGDVAFQFSALYIKGEAAMVKQAPLGDLGNNPPATKTGLLSRTYLSVVSVKKQVV